MVLWRYGKRWDYRINHVCLAMFSRDESFWIVHVITFNSSFRWSKYVWTRLEKSIKVSVEVIVAHCMSIMRQGIDLVWENAVFNAILISTHVWKCTAPNRICALSINSALRWFIKRELKTIQICWTHWINCWQSKIILFKLSYEGFVN